MLAQGRTPATSSGYPINNGRHTTECHVDQQITNLEEDQDETACSGKIDALVWIEARKKGVAARGPSLTALNFRRIAQASFANLFDNGFGPL